MSRVVNHEKSVRCDSKMRRGNWRTYQDISECVFCAYFFVFHLYHLFHPSSLEKFFKREKGGVLLIEFTSFGKKVGHFTIMEVSNGLVILHPKNFDLVAVLIELDRGMLSTV